MDTNNEKQIQSSEKAPIETKDRPKFLFYRSFKEAIDQLPEKDQLPIYQAIASFALDGTEPDFAPGTPGGLIWPLISPVLKRDLILWDNGKAGGCPRGTKKPSMIGNRNASKHRESDSENEETKPNQNQNKTKTKPNQNQENKTPSIDNRQETIDKEERVRETSSLTSPSPQLLKKQQEAQKRKEAFKKSLEPYLEKYGRDILNGFFDHWAEFTPDRTKMLWETKKTWETAARLRTWKRMETQFNR